MTEIKDITIEDLGGTHQEIAKAIGLENALKLFNDFGGIIVPSLYEVKQIARDKGIVEMWKAGLRVVVIARKYGVDKSTVYLVLKKNGCR